ncbi:hypothetical protein AQUCO_00100628v1 [Aquilegia coerulea]|uniref:Uncharacterized protein n=1 Tax=Aquilegia coerulea TaxID=218851 RepID=A0A2G5FBF7_AQUCA|nr:hypothetical protein AQUCO_00100628v1 [Aquilegia coerulea]
MHHSFIKKCPTMSTSIDAERRRVVSMRVCSLRVVASAAMRHASVAWMCFAAAVNSKTSSDKLNFMDGCTGSYVFLISYILC